MNQALNDIWVNLQSYYDDLIVLLPKILLAIFIFMVLLFISNRVRDFTNARLSRRMDDPLLVRFISRVAKTAIIILAILMVLQILGLAGIAAGIITGASVSAIVVGFAFKDIGENFLAGIMLAFNRPFRVGDTVEFNGYKGTVIALNLRNSQIKTFDGKDIFIPNANVIKNPVVNYTMDGYLRYEFVVGLDYGSDADKAIAIILNTVNSIKGICNDEKKTAVGISGLGSSSLELTVYYWLDTFDKTVSSVKIKTRVVYQVLEALNAAGFYMPGDVMEVKNYNDIELKTKSKSDAESPVKA